MPAPLHRRGLILFVRLGLALALVLDLYLAWHSGTPGALAGCGPDSSCDQVLQSRWAYWLGLPVSWFGALAVAVLLSLTFRIDFHARADQQPQLWLALLSLSVAIAAAALWFAALQVMAVRAICPYCMISHLAAGSASIVLWWITPVHRSTSRRAPPGLLPARRASRAEGFGLVAFCALMAGQVLVQPPRGVTRTLTVTPAPTAPPDRTPMTPREIVLHDGQFRFDLSELPLLGPANSQRVVVSLFDYTCHHCRELHELFALGRRTTLTNVAVLALPMPLDAHCNAYIKRTPPAHAQACAYASMALAVWRAAPAKFAEYDSWLFAPERPPPLEEAQARAEQLVGTVLFASAISDPWVLQQIRTNVALYGANEKKLGSGQIPQLLFGAKAHIGPMSSLNELEQFIEGPAPPR